MSVTYDDDLDPEEEKLTEISDERADQVADAAQIVGYIVGKRADGTIVPMLDEEGNEIVGIAGY